MSKKKFDRMRRFKKAFAFLLSCALFVTPTAVYAADADAVIGTLSMDTFSYTMAPGDVYGFKASLNSSVLRQEDVKVWSSRDGITKVARVAGTGKYHITGLEAGVTYITSEIKGVRASIQVTVGNGVRPHGVTNWTISLIHQSDLSPTVNITFSEGTNLMGVAALLKKNHVCSAGDMLATAKNTQFNSCGFIASLTSASSRYYRFEGYLFPDTYNFYKGGSAANTLKRMLNNVQNRMTDPQTQAAAQGMTVDQLLTMASLVQVEASSTSDMYLVSSVLHNRLTNGAAHDTPRLQFDSAVFYPYRVKSEAPAGSTSIYDTYSFSDLPIGPVCNPGASAIDTALHPSSTNYHYFCHSASDTGYYVETLDEHDQNLIIADLR